MAHNLNFNEQTGQHSFFSVKEKAWHGLGKIIQDYPTSAEAIQHAGLDYTVEKRPLFTYDTENRENSLLIQPTPRVDAEVEVPNYFAIIRTDSDIVLGVVGKDYQIVQNRDAFSFFDSIVGGDGIQYETAGALGNGERIFITAKLPDYIKVGREDLIEQYLFLTTSHDGFGSITAAFTPVRIVCNNTLNAAVHSKNNAIKVRHTANAKERLEQAHRVMGISNRLSVELESIFNRWATVRITDPEVRKLIQLAMVPNKEVLQNLNAGKDDDLSTCFKNMADSVYQYAMNDPTQLQETTQGTVFGAYNAVTGYFQNVRGYKDQEAKVKSLFFGGTAQLRTQAAFNLCTSFAQYGQDSLLLN
jgi:phage/plasmid-like protein (TIGR03299 family)